MTEKEMKAEITQAHIDGYNRGYAKAKEKIADIKANCDLAIEGRDIKIKELEQQIEKMKCCENCRWEEPSSFCDNCKRLEGQIFADTLTSDNWEIKENGN